MPIEGVYVCWLGNWCCQSAGAQRYEGWVNGERLAKLKWQLPLSLMPFSFATQFQKSAGSQLFDKWHCNSRSSASLLQGIAVPPQGPI